MEYSKTKYEYESLIYSRPLNEVASEKILKNMKFHIRVINGLFVDVYKIVKCTNTQTLIQCFPVYSKLRNSILYVRNSFLYEFLIESSFEVKILILNIAPDDICTIENLSKSFIYLKIKDDIFVINCDENKISISTKINSSSEILSYYFLQNLDEQSLFLIFENKIYSIDSNNQSKSLDFDFEFEKLRTFIFIKRKVFLTFILNQSYDKTPVKEFEIDLLNLYIEKEKNYAIFEKQDFLFCLDFLIDISLLFVLSIMPDMIDSPYYSINELWLIKDSYLFKINDSCVDFFSIDFRMKFEINVDHLNSKNLSGWKINIADDYFFVKNLTDIHMRAYSLASRTNLISGHDIREFNDTVIYTSENLLKNSYKVVKYIKKYKFCLGKFVCELGGSKDYFCFFYDQGGVRIPTNCFDKRDKSFCLSDESRFISYSSLTGKAVMLDLKKCIAKYFRSLRFKDIIYISEEEKCVYARAFDCIIKYKIKELEIDRIEKIKF